MRHAIYRYIVDFEKEEKWLNEMAEKGMNFIYFSFPGRYLFEEGTPGEYIYRLEFLDNTPDHPDSKAYIRFVEETGAELVSTYFRWVWFRKKASDGPFDLYSDYPSRIRHYRRLSFYIGTLGLLNLIIGLFNLVFGLLEKSKYTGHINAFISPISFLIVILCLRVYASYMQRMRRLEKESQVHE
jgi:hypothetical protein